MMLLCSLCPLVGDEDETYAGSLDIAQIDARLSALQRFMKANLKAM